MESPKRFLTPKTWTCQGAQVVHWYGSDNGEVLPVGCQRCTYLDLYTYVLKDLEAK